MMWLGWDLLKVGLGLAAGNLADNQNVWVISMLGLLAQSFMIFIVAEAANAALHSKEEWKLTFFLIAVGCVLGLGTTVDGFIGGPFIKLMTEVERLLGQECYEELFAISVTVIAFGEMMGNFYAGWAYDALGFNLCTYGFAWCHLVGMLCCGYGIQGMVRPLFETEKKGLDDPDAV